MKYILIIIPFFFLLSCGDSKSPNAKTTNLDSLLVIYPDSIPLLIEHGSKMLKEFQYDKAFAEGAKAFRLDSNNIEARLFYADVLNNRPNRTVSDVLVAQRHFKVIIKKDPKNLKALVSLATTFSQQQDFDKSFQYINEALKINPRYRDAYVLKGTNYLHLNNVELAKSSYETAVQQDPKFFEAYVMLGSLYQSENNKICLEYYTTAAQLQPKNTDVLYALAFADQEFNKLNEAKSIYRKMIELDTTYAEALFQQGYIKQWLEKERDLDSAMYFYNSCIQTKPEYVEAWHNLGICYLDKEDKPNAMLSFRKALSFNPNFTLSKELIEKYK
jgi:tetratricopeptide (TPR) repeat protein